MLRRICNSTLILVLALGLVPAVSASSHREAPAISQDPSVDATDLYAFRSPDLSDTVTIIANYNPLEEPSNGPNFYRFADGAISTSTSTTSATPGRTSRIASSSAPSSAMHPPSAITPAR